jgi:hypothetical protein
MALAPLPIKKQIVPGTGLLLVLPPLLIWLAYDFGVLVVVLCIGGAVSLFRKPLSAGLKACGRRFTRD